MSPAEIAQLRPTAASMGLMLETSAARLSARGGPHYGSPDKHPAVRLQALSDLGASRVPTTTGLLIGIGETRRERLEALCAIRALNRKHGHVQEVIIQNFRAKLGTRMESAREPEEEELLWTVAAARLLLDGDISLQAPPNLNAHSIVALIDAGLNDWGGISPVTIDHVNPERPWPQIDQLAQQCAAQDFALSERLTVYPAYLNTDWMASGPRVAALALADGAYLAREEDWSPGQNRPAPAAIQPLPAPLGSATITALDRIASGRTTERDIAALFDARGAAARRIVSYADELRQAVSGDTVTYVVNRNINYTNICTYHCTFCAFSKTSARAGLRDKPYRLSDEEVAERVVEAARTGATEVCLQGGIHPAYDGNTYRAICRAVKAALPSIHVHAFSPLEVTHGASTLGLSVTAFLSLLKQDGLSSLPGTAAEILCEDVRAVLCPDKLTSSEWLNVVRDAHSVGLRTTATIMFGHVDRYDHWARHLTLIRRLQEETGGFTEFVPLPFVHMQTPIFQKGLARAGPTWRECVLMHAIARIALHGAIDNIQTSWVKLGLDGATACLMAGANDVGGVLMNESISRAAGAAHGQSLDLPKLHALLADQQRPLVQRTTFYDRCASADAPH
jgi:FO synthase